MIYKKGGFLIMRHNEVRNVIADLLKEVCYDAAVEAALRPLTGKCFQQSTSNTNSGGLSGHIC